MIIVDRKYSDRVI